MVVSSIPGCCASAGKYCDGYHLQVGMPLRYAASHPGQLSLLLSVGWELTTNQGAVMCCGWGLKEGWLIPFVDNHVGLR